jgi:hypothetical protein
MPDQRGPARAPNVDVFNGWKVNSHEGGYFATVDMPPEWPDWQADRETCVGKRRRTMMTSSAARNTCALTF